MISELQNVHCCSKKKWYYSRPRGAKFTIFCLLLTLHPCGCWQGRVWELCFTFSASLSCHSLLCPAHRYHSFYFNCSRLTNGRSFSYCHIQVLALVSRVASYLKKLEGVSENSEWFSLWVCRNTFNTNTQVCQHDVILYSSGCERSSTCPL